MPQLDIPKSRGKSNKKRAQQVPQTADDFLELADQEELGGGKWKAGDPTKACRFFDRAIQLYNEGLRRYPQSFDLAYNRARLLYLITQDLRLLRQQDGTAVELLQQALASHRYALTINQEDVDAIYNTAQVLSSLAEALTEDKHTTKENRDEAIKCLEEAVDMLASCLALQEIRYEEQSATVTGQDVQMDDEEAKSINAEGVPLDSPAPGASQAEETEESVTILAPITLLDLLDTVTTQLNALADFCGKLTHDHGSGLANIEEIGINIVKRTIPSYVNRLDQDSTIDEEERQSSLNSSSISIVRFSAAFSMAEYRCRRIAALECFSRIRDSIASRNPKTSSTTDAEAVTTYGEILQDFDETIRNNIHGLDVPQLASLRWQALSAAQECFEQACVSTLKMRPPTTGGPTLTLSLSSTGLAPSNGLSSEQIKQLGSLFLRRGDAYLALYTTNSICPQEGISIPGQEILQKSSQNYEQSSRYAAQDPQNALTDPPRALQDGVPLQAEAIVKSSVVDCIAAGLENESVGNDRKQKAVAVLKALMGKGIDVGDVFEDMLSDAMVPKEVLEGIADIIG